MAGRQNDPPRKYPYNPFRRKTFNPLTLMWRTGVEDDWPDIPVFARRLLEHLRDASLPRDTGNESSYDNLRPVQADGSDQALFVLFDAYRDPLGYAAVDVIG